jgi:hypothetical protein
MANSSTEMAIFQRVAERGSFAGAANWFPSEFCNADVEVGGCATKDMGL